MGREREQPGNAADLQAEIASLEARRSGLVSGQIIASLLAVGLSVVATAASIFLDVGMDVFTIPPERLPDLIDWDAAIFILLANAFYVVWAGVKRLRLSMQMRKLRKQAERLGGKP